MITKKELDEKLVPMASKEDLTDVKEDLKNVKEDLKKMASKEDLKKMELDLKDHIDEKLGELKGDLVGLVRKEDKKLLYLAKSLNKEDSLSNNTMKNISKMEPFPKLAL
jgi:hypothetical protein